MPLSHPESLSRLSVSLARVLYRSALLDWVVPLPTIDRHRRLNEKAANAGQALLAEVIAVKLL
jgi:hypothetical protein